MDCEKFDQHVIDALYGELDELTQAGLERHVEGCARCGPVYAGLRATRTVAVLPIEEPPADLEARILAAADLQIKAPWRRRVARAIAWGAAQAVRPQTAVAAVFFLVLGSSLFLFRASPDRAAAPAAIAPETAAAREAPAPAPAATAAAKATPTPPVAPPDPDLSPKLAAERSPDAGKLGGDPPAVEASAAPAEVAAVPSVAAGHASAGPLKAVEGQAAANERSRAAPAKPAARSVGGTNPRAPAAPRYNDAFH